MARATSRESSPSSSTWAIVASPLRERLENVVTQTVVGPRKLGTAGWPLSTRSAMCWRGCLLSEPSDGVGRAHARPQTRCARAVRARAGPRLGSSPDDRIGRDEDALDERGEVEAAAVGPHQGEELADHRVRGEEWSAEEHRRGDVLQGEEGERGGSAPVRGSPACQTTTVLTAQAAHTRLSRASI